MESIHVAIGLVNPSNQLFAEGEREFREAILPDENHRGLLS